MGEGLPVHNLWRALEHVQGFHTHAQSLYLLVMHPGVGDA